MVAARRMRRALGAAVLLACGLVGCVERRYTIRTDPPGALVIVNRQEIGPSPVSAPFTYYGDREITLIQDGYKTQHLVQPIKAPWWDSYLTEFFTENLIPVNFRDEREFTYHMEPAVNPPTPELLDRAGTLRAAGQTIPPPRRGGILGWLGF